MRKLTWQKRSEETLAQKSPGTNSKRPSQYVEGVYPTHVIKAQGPYIWDQDGNRYIDFVGGLGAVILGYNHPKVNDAVKAQINTGVVTSSFPSTIEIETAELVQDVFPAAEKIRFLKTGSEACSAAVRIARANKNRAAVVSKGYHGHSDAFISLTKPASGVKDKFFVYGRAEEVKKPLAAYIFEPIELDATKARQKEIIQVMQYCSSHSALMIFDEVITACRVPQMSVHKWWSFSPDLVVLGKGLANGYPLSVVAGKKDIMDQKDYFISSTFSGEAVSLAACKATLEELRTKSMKDLTFYGERLCEKINEICKEIGVRIHGYGTRGMLDVTTKNAALFMQECCKGGVIFGKAFFYHFGHLEGNVEDYVLNIVGDAAGKIKRGDVKLEGKPPQQVFNR